MEVKFQVLIALDHDGTYTRARDIWDNFIHAMEASGHRVICISSRFPNVPISGMPVPVYYTCGQQKWEFAQERGLAVDIWIDDIPSCIGGPPGLEPGQAPIRREYVKKFIDTNFNVGPYESR